MKLENNAWLISALENAHYDLQLGMYLSKVVKTPEVTFVYSDRINDFYWNYASQLNFGADNQENMVSKIIKYFKNIDRLPAVYITPTCRPSEIKTYLEKKNFQIQFSDAWMLYSGNKLPLCKTEEDVLIKTVETFDDMKIFADVFIKVYGSDIEGDPYGGLPESYPNTVLYSFNYKSPAKNMVNYLAYVDKDPIGIGTIILTNNVGGIYNMGTIPDFRKGGIGTLLAAKAIKDAFERRIETIFLQTEKDSYVEKFYNKLGFETKYVGEGYVLEE